MAKFCGSPRCAIGTRRARAWRGRGDVRGYRPARGWIASGELVDVHPITGKALRASQWWVFEKFTGGA